MKHTQLIALLLVISLISPLRAQDAEDYLSYDIPANAEKIGPGNDKDNTLWYHFFFPAGVRTQESLVGKENYDCNQLIERELMKKGRKHGLQKTWHRNGTLQSESPYQDGVMHGTFREWNEKGQLIAQYTMVHGTGRKRLYNDAGLLMIDEPMEQSRKNGLCMERSRIEGTLSLFQIKKGALVGKAFSFYPTSQLMSLVCHSEKGALHGPYITFSEFGEVTHKKWYHADKEYSESDYALLTAKDKTLPPCFEDATIYQSLVDAKVKDALESYRHLPLVKIPLELDPAGNPVPKP